MCRALAVHDIDCHASLCSARNDREQRPILSLRGVRQHDVGVSTLDMTGNSLAQIPHMRSE